MSVRALPALYAIVDPLDTGRDPLALAEAMPAGGARLLQLRLKDAPTSTLLEVGHALRRSTARHGALLIVNDRPDVARAIGADGVHLRVGRSSARRRAPPCSRLPSTTRIATNSRSIQTPTP